MAAALDIYIKLLIAIISFIAPLLINLLSIFSEGIAVKRKQFKEYEDNMNRILKSKLDVDASISKLLNEDGEKFKKEQKKSEKQLELLDPKKQIYRIFPTFFYSLVLIIIYQLLLDKDILTLIPGKNILACCSLILSVLLAVRGVYILKEVVIAIIDVKQEIAEDKAKEQQSEKGQKVTLPLDKNDKINS